MVPDVEVLTKFLVPALPFLYKATDKVVDGALAKLGEDGWEMAKGLWTNLWPKVEAEPVITAAIEGVLVESDNADRQVVLKMALQDMLTKNPELAKELAELLRNSKPLPTIQVTINSKGDKNIITGVNYGQVGK